MRLLVVVWAVAAQALSAPAAFAAEPFKLYDKFSDRPLDPGRWLGGERARSIKGGALHLMQRDWSSDAANVGVTTTNWGVNFAEPATITQMRARIVVDALEANACPGNGTVGDARVRIIGGFFNTGEAIAGSQVNDVTAQVRLARLSNSADPAGLLRVEGVVIHCTTADCAAGFAIGNIVDLGTVAIGTATTVQLEWDQGGQSFRFSRDGGRQAGTVGYAESGLNPPGVLFRQLSTRLNVPNCMAGPLSGFADAKFDNVYVNQTARP